MTSPENTASAPSAAAAERLDGKRWPIVLALIAAACFLLFLQTSAFEFVYDDRSGIVYNPSIQSWKEAPGYFLRSVWGHSEGTVANYYRPLHLLWMLANYSSFGLEPTGWHLTTVLLHLAVTILVALLALRLTGDSWTASAAALLFGVHPAHVEAVAWVSGATEPLLALFLLPAFLAYLRARREGGRIWTEAALIFFALALLCKETAIIFPVLVFAYEIFTPRETEAHRHGGLRPALRATAPYLAIIVVYALLRWKALGGFSHGATPDASADAFYSIPRLLGIYFARLFWPFHLAPFSDIRLTTQAEFVGFALPALALVVVAYILVLLRRRRPSLGLPMFLGIWMLVPLLPPMFNLALLPPDLVIQNRYLYLPSVAACLLIAMFIRHRLAHWPHLATGVVLIFAAALAGETWVSCQPWHDNFTLFRFAVEKAPGNEFARVLLASQMMEEGDTANALVIAREAESLRPRDWFAVYTVAGAEFRLGQWGAAERDYLRAIQLSPSLPQARGDQFYQLGLVRMRMGRYREGADTIRQGLKLWPHARNFHYAIGMGLLQAGDLEGARAEFEAELRLDPQHGAARRELERLGEAKP